jgi:hypothetical protein
MIARTKKQQLQEQLALANAVRLGICACMVNLVAEHARVTDKGDPAKAFADIRAAMQNTASSLKVNAKDTAGDTVEISEIVQRNVSKILDEIVSSARKQVSKSVH